MFGNADLVSGCTWVSWWLQKKSVPELGGHRFDLGIPIQPCGNVFEQDSETLSAPWVARGEMCSCMCVSEGCARKQIPNTHTTKELKVKIKLKKKKDNQRKTNLEI